MHLRSKQRGMRSLFNSMSKRKKIPLCMQPRTGGSGQGVRIGKAGLHFTSHRDTLMRLLFNFATFTQRLN